MSTDTNLFGKAKYPDHMSYQDGMENIGDEIFREVIEKSNAYNAQSYTKQDVLDALSHDSCSFDDLCALLSPAAATHLEQLARRASELTARHFGNSVSLFTPLYISNYCENHCLYCGFNKSSKIRRMRLSQDELESEMKIIADSGMEEVLILTGESEKHSPLEYIGKACRTARKYFKNVALEIYPVNTDAYRYLHECGADYVTVFQETYDCGTYGRLHAAGRKRSMPYRFNAQERAIRGGMRGVAFGALFGLSDFRRDALATAMHLHLLQRKYPHAEMSLSCPRLRPTVGSCDFEAHEIGERELCQILCAWRIFLPFANITVSSRESARFRDGIVRVAATKISAGVSTGVGDHKSKYSKADSDTPHGDEQFEICDARSLHEMCHDMKLSNMQPVLNDSVFINEDAGREF